RTRAAQRNCRPHWAASPWRHLRRRPLNAREISATGRADCSAIVARRSRSAPLRHRVAIGFGLVTLLAAATAHAAAKPACRPAILGSAQVRSVLDGRTVQLTDGREVRLAGIEVPQKHDSAAKTALETLVSGRDIALLRLGADSDRYGRVVSLVSVEPGAAEIGQSVQRALLAQGQARVTANIGDSACTANLLEAERTARGTRPGL